MLAAGGEHLDALLASFKREQLKREQLLRQCELSPAEQPSSSSVVAEQWPSCALAEPQNLTVEAATVPRQQQLRLKQELASAQQAVAAAEAAEMQQRRRKQEEQRQRQHGRVEAWREARDLERALEAARLESEQARQRHERQRQQEQRHSRAARTLQRAHQHLLEQDAEEHAAATIVQSQFRGKQARQEVEAKKAEQRAVAA